MKSIFNKANVKKFIKQGRKNTLFYNKEQCWLSDSYTGIKVDEMVRSEIIKEFLKDESLFVRDGKIQDEVFDFTFFIKDDKRDKGDNYYPTNYIHKAIVNRKEMLSTIYLHNDKELHVNKIYNDLINDEDLDHIETTSGGVTHPLMFHNDYELVAFILPIRTPELDYRIKKV